MDHLDTIIQYSFKYFSGSGKQRYGTVIFQYLLISFFMSETTFAFFHSRGNFPLSKHDLNINSGGLQREASESLTIRTIIIS